MAAPDDCAVLDDGRSRNSRDIKIRRQIPIFFCNGNANARLSEPTLNVFLAGVACEPGQPHNLKTLWTQRGERFVEFRHLSLAVWAPGCVEADDQEFFGTRHLVKVV